MLLRASAETTITIVVDPKHLGARIGVTAVLQTDDHRVAISNPSSRAGSGNKP
jgi:hypothetical protein